MPFIHSTELRKAAVDISARKIKSGIRTIRGPAVLLPRVGTPNALKVAVLKDSTVALSDCVFALGCRSQKAAAALKRSILDGWSSFEKLYTGTGARYVTIAKLIRWLGTKGYTVVRTTTAIKKA